LGDTSSDDVVAAGMVDHFDLKPSVTAAVESYTSASINWTSAVSDHLSLNSPVSMHLSTRWSSPGTWCTTSSC